MTRSWDNLVSALAGVQMALGGGVGVGGGGEGWEWVEEGKKWGQADYRAEDIHPEISPTVKQHGCAKCLRKEERFCGEGDRQLSAFGLEKRIICPNRRHVSRRFALIRHHRLDQC